MRRLTFRKAVCRTLLIGAALINAGCTYQPSAGGRPEAPLYQPPTRVAPTPTATPMPFALGERVTIPDGSFSFQPITEWALGGHVFTLNLSENRADLVSEDGALYFSLSAVQINLDMNAEDCLKNFSARVSADLQDATASPAQGFTAGNFAGLAQLLSGKLLDQPVVIGLNVLAPHGRCFTLLSLASGPQSQSLFEESAPLREALLANLQFAENSAGSVCLAASDPTYGHSPDNPIRVGNTNLYDGRAREENYLLTLRSPEGSEVFFSRQLPLYNRAGEIVDPYTLTYEGLAEPVTLYFDIYEFDTLLVPAGFICEAPFTLREP